METKVGIQLKGKLFEGKAPEIGQQAREGFMYEALAYLEGLVKKGTPQGVYGAQGGLLSTIHGEVVEKGASVIKGIVAHGSAHGDVIERGRRAGKKWPPEGALLRWIEVKMGKSETEAKRLEFVVRRKIGKKGFPGAEMFGHALEAGWPKLLEMANRYGLQITQEFNA